MVSMSVSNRSYGAGLAEMQNTTEGELALATHKHVIFNADMLIMFEDWLVKAKRKAAASEVNNPTLMEFPGLKWNSSISEVKKALNLKKEQILLDEMLPGEGVEYDSWALSVKDVPFFGFETEKVIFTFIRYPGNDYGLLNIKLYIPGEMDVNMVKDAMNEAYGAGSTEFAPSYFVNEDGQLEETDKDSLVKITDAEEGFPYYWYSTVMGSDALSAAAQERLVENAFTLRPDNNQDSLREAMLGYLEKTCAVRVSFMDWTTEETSLVTYNANLLVHNLQQFEE